MLLFYTEKNNKRVKKTSFVLPINKIHIYLEYIIEKSRKQNNILRNNYTNCYTLFNKHSILIKSTTEPIIRDKIYSKILFIKNNVALKNSVITKYNLLPIQHKHINTQSSYLNYTFNNRILIENYLNLYLYYIKYTFLSNSFNIWKNLFAIFNLNNRVFKGIFNSHNNNNIKNYSNSLKDITSGLVLIEYIFECKQLSNNHFIVSELNLLLHTCISYEENILKYIRLNTIFSFKTQKSLLILDLSVSSNKYENISSIILPNNIIIPYTYSINILNFKLFTYNLNYFTQEHASKISSIFSFNLIVESLIKQYLKNGIVIPSMQFELVAKKMTSFVKINYSSESSLLENEYISFEKIECLNYIYNIFGYKQILYTPIILGITKSTLAYSGLLSSISFQEIIKYLIKLSIESCVDWITDFKSKIITTDLTKTGSGWYRHFIKI